MKPTLAILALFLVGCSATPTPTPTPQGSQWSEPVKDDTPYRNFSKTWHMQITPDISLSEESTYSPWLETGCSAYCTFVFTMQQGDNPAKWINFDCDAVAEKIVQARLVNLAEIDCKMLRDEATQYWKDHTDPNEFTDSTGHVWRRHP